MADTLYFSRDTKVYIKIGSAVWEIPVLDGFGFSQATNASEITLNEMSDTFGNSRRARQMFTDSYAPAEWSFATYARPFVSDGTAGASGHHHAVEEALWAMMVGDAAYGNASAAGAIDTLGTATVPTTDAQAGAFAGTYEIATSSDGNGEGATLNVTISALGAFSVALNNAGSGYDVGDKLFVSAEDVAAASGAALGDIDADIEVAVTAITTTTGTSFTGFTRDSTDLNIDFDSSNKTTLGTADIYFVLGGAGSGTKTTYKISECCVNEASIDFDIDGIATINWSGMGKIITEDTAPTPTITEGVNGTGNFIRNRLTSLAVTGDGSTFQSSYNMVLTGGNITISNNMTFLTPETLGIVNQPLGHVTGTRTVSGNFTCYLNAATDSSADLFEDLIEATDSVTNNFGLLFKIGGTGTPRIELNMPKCHLEVPTHSIDDVISVETNFHALPTTIDDTDELVVTYVGQ